MEKPETRDNQGMDEQLLRKVSRQLKLLNVMIASTLLLVLATLGVMLFLAWQALTFIQQTRTQIEDVRRNTGQALDLREQLCGQSGDAGEYIRRTTNLCQ